LSRRAVSMNGADVSICRLQAEHAMLIKRYRISH